MAMQPLEYFNQPELLDGSSAIVFDDPWQAVEDRTTELERLRVEILRLEGVLDRAAAWHFQRPGKQTRARLALAAGSALGAPDRGVAWCAASAQLLHEASLIHDDLQDGDELRRGQEAVWKRFSPQVALALGDALIGAAIEAAVRGDGDSRATSPNGCTLEVLWALRVTACGQADENEQKGSASLDLDRYHDLSRRKTGPLFALPVLLAMRLAGCDEPSIATARSALERFGIAYQIHDDLADVVGRKQRGAAGADFVEGKRTAPVLHYLARGGSEELVEDALRQGARPRHRELLLLELTQSGAVDATVRELEGILAQAHAGLEQLPIRLRRTLVSAFRDLRASADRMRTAPSSVLRGHDSNSKR
jgi:geranylgeranyl pyrophosphate synthase